MQSHRVTAIALVVLMLSVPTQVVDTPIVVNTSGVVTAVGAGTATIHVTQGAVQQKAIVSVMPSQDTFTPNLPSWANTNTLQIDTRFDRITTRRQDTLFVTQMNTLNTITSVNGIGPTPDGTTFFRVKYAGNDAGDGYGGAEIFTSIGGWRRMYVAARVWVPTDYVIHTNEEKFLYPKIHINGQQVAHTIIGWYTRERMYGAAQGHGASSSTWGMGYNAQLGQGRRYQPNNGVWLQKGRWNLIEVEILVNQNGPNGTLKIWVNGTQALFHQGVQFTQQEGQAVVGSLLISSIRGGGASTVLTPPDGQERRYSRLVVHGLPTM
jgi:hypothetical protein